MEEYKKDIEEFIILVINSMGTKYIKEARYMCYRLFDIPKTTREIKEEIGYFSFKKVEKIKQKLNISLPLQSAEKFIERYSKELYLSDRVISKTKELDFDNDIAWIEAIMRIYIAGVIMNESISIRKISEITNVSRPTILKFIKEAKNNEKIKNFI